MLSTTPTPQARDEPPAPQLWFRALLPSGSLGPGKMDLIRLIGEMGSVSAAAKQLRMSHARSVKLVAEINALGSRPLIVTRSGGPSGGGASLTDAGRALVDRYEELGAAVDQAAAPHLKALLALLGPSEETSPPVKLA